MGELSFDPATPPIVATPGEFRDTDLLLHVRDGSAEAFAELFRRHHAVALRVARRLGAPDDADDVAAEAFERILDLLSRGQGPRDDFRSYLLASVRHEVFRRARRAGREVLTDDDDDLDRESEGLLSSRIVEAHIVRSAFQTLPERWRRVLWLLDVEGWRPREVAELLELSPNSVSALVYRARRAMRDAYVQQHLRAPSDEGDDGHVRGALIDYQCGVLRVREHHRVVLHLRDCRECAGVLQDLRAIGICESRSAASSSGDRWDTRSRAQAAKLRSLILRPDPKAEEAQSRGA